MVSQEGKTGRRSIIIVFRHRFFIYTHDRLMTAKQRTQWRVWDVSGSVTLGLAVRRSDQKIRASGEHSAGDLQERPFPTFEPDTTERSISSGKVICGATQP